MLLTSYRTMKIGAEARSLEASPSSPTTRSVATGRGAASSSHAPSFAPPRAEQPSSKTSRRDASSTTRVPAVTSADTSAAISAAAVAIACETKTNQGGAATSFGAAHEPQTYTHVKITFESRPQKSLPNYLINYSPARSAKHRPRSWHLRTSPRAWCVWHLSTTGCGGWSCAHERVARSVVVQ